MNEPIPYKDVWHTPSHLVGVNPPFDAVCGAGHFLAHRSDFQIREQESARRQAMLSVHSENRRIKRKAQIEGLLIGCLILFAGFAWWGNRPILTSPDAAGLTNATASGAPLTAENAPIVLKPLVKHKRRAAK